MTSVFIEKIVQHATEKVFKILLITKSYFFAPTILELTIIPRYKSEFSGAVSL